MNSSQLACEQLPRPFSARSSLHQSRLLIIPVKSQLRSLGSRSRAPCVLLTRICVYSNAVANSVTHVKKAGPHIVTTGQVVHPVLSAPLLQEV